MPENTINHIEKLLAIMAALRNPETGCPWDIEQDFASIAPYTVEEAYEVTDAIERKDMHDLKDELGDLLFQVVFHAQMAKEQGAFDFDDVVAAINSKLLRRHPHVFDGERIDNKQQLAQRWEQHKQNERIKKNNNRILDDVPNRLPALRWSQKLQQRAASAGFDWPSIKPVFDKLDEEVQELKHEIKCSDNQQRIMDEYGDVLFVCVNLAMHLNLNAEQSLRYANNKFINRFTLMERLVEQGGASYDSLSLQKMEEYWQRAKEILSS